MSRVEYLGEESNGSGETEVLRAVHVLMATWSDGSGKPEVLQVYTDRARAEADLEMINRAHPLTSLSIVTTNLQRGEQQ